jgi:hypothetical protein
MIGSATTSKKIVKKNTLIGACLFAPGSEKCILFMPWKYFAGLCTGEHYLSRV